MTEYGDYLLAAGVAPEVTALRPDYRALLMVASGITPGPSDDTTDAWLAAAEQHARDVLAAQPVTEIAHVAAWRDAYREFGAKPQRTRNSLEALLRRAAAGLPRVNRLTDTYNAVSVLHLVPLGGENLAGYTGPPRLLRATGAEPFDTAADGADLVEYPDPGEVVWCDDTGVTCRRWNWRQCRRTQLTHDTTDALFIIDALAPMTDDQLHATADDLAERLASLGDAVTTTRRQLPDTGTR